MIFFARFIRGKYVVYVLLKTTPFSTTLFTLSTESTNITTAWIILEAAFILSYPTTSPTAKPNSQRHGILIPCRWESPPSHDFFRPSHRAKRCRKEHQTKNKGKRILQQDEKVNYHCEKSKVQMLTLILRPPPAPDAHTWAPNRERERKKDRQMFYVAPFHRFKCSLAILLHAVLFKLN